MCLPHAQAAAAQRPAPPCPRSRALTHLATLLDTAFQISSGYELPALATRRWLANDSAMASPSAPWETVCSVVGVEMATEPKNLRFSERHRQVLEVLAMAPEGRGVNDLLTLGFELETIADLIRGELA